MAAQAGGEFHGDDQQHSGSAPDNRFKKFREIVWRQFGPVKLLKGSGTHCNIEAYGW
ncbi:hypothetical protein [Polaromonas sp. JS666]|uniref:hypothetical protein n=1 Tax=Polaromonas sp. (strain JS666 / ATCC BAA-500) TaxID=296591 RepID=UPI00004647F8|nr:hypothetical protein [Polaromonas sp. JS666]